MLAAVGKAQFHVIVGAEFQIGDVPGSSASSARNSWKPLGGGVVRARRADDVQPLKPQFLFQRAQRIDLAGDADDGEAAVAAGERRFQQGEQRRVAHAHAAALRHAGGLGDQHRAWAASGRSGRRPWRAPRPPRRFPAGGRRCGGDAGPLRPLGRRHEGRAQRAAIGTEERLILACRGRGCGRARGFPSPGSRADELAGLAAALVVRGARNAAIGAEASGARRRRAVASRPGRFCPAGVSRCAVLVGDPGWGGDGKVTAAGVTGRGIAAGLGCGGGAVRTRSRWRSPGARHGRAGMTGSRPCAGPRHRCAPAGFHRG